MTKHDPNSPGGKAGGKERSDSETVYAPLIGVMWRTLESYGVAPQTVIPRNLYRPGADSSVSRRISLAVYYGLLQQIEERVDDPAVGLRAAQQLHPSHLGALGHAWLASTTLREAIGRTARYHRMLDESLVLNVDEERERLRISYVLKPGSPIPEKRLDSQMASLLQMGRFNFGPELQALEVKMQRESPADPSPWIEFFGPKLVFGAGENSLSLRLSDVDQVLTVASPQLVSVLEEILQRHMAELDRSDVVNRARVAIVELLPSGNLSEEAVAARLNITSRTLYNHLNAQGWSFRKLATHTRRQLAERYLLDASYSMTEISFLLGFSDSSAFSRAFRTWEGVSPSRYHQSLSGTRARVPGNTTRQ